MQMAQVESILKPYLCQARSYCALKRGLLANFGAFQGINAPLAVFRRWSFSGVCSIFYRAIV